MSKICLTGGVLPVRSGALDILARIASIPGFQGLSLTTYAILLG